MSLWPAFTNPDPRHSNCKGWLIADGRIQVAKLRLQKQNGQVTAITAGSASHPAPSSDEDFTAHTNPPGTWLDFGKVATDGSLKINRESDRLVIFPYPRDKSFRASLDLKALAPAAKRTRLKIRALAAETQRDLGPVDFKILGGRLLLTFATPGAGRYLVTWQASHEHPAQMEKEETK